MTLKTSSLVGISGILIGILGVIGPIAWDYYKTKSEIEFRVVENSVVIEKPQRLEGLLITYAGEEVQELSKLTINVSNAGRTPILKKDIVQPLTLQFTPESKILETKVESSVPKDLTATIQLDRLKGVVSLDFPLMNPGDHFQIIALAKSVKPEFDVMGRIAGVGAFNIVKDIPQKSSQKSPPWTVYPVGFFSALLLLASIVGFLHAPAELKTKRALRRGKFQVPPLTSSNECLRWIDRHFFFTTSKEREAMKLAISKLPDQQNFTAVHHQAIVREAQLLVENALSNITMALLVLAISLLGFSYVWSSF